MFKKCIAITLGLAALLGLNFSPIEAGVILNIYRIDLPGGKRAIIFGEQHDDEVDVADDVQVPVQAIAQNQNQGIDHLFRNDLLPRRDLISTYLECSADLREDLKEGLLERLESADPQQILDLNKPWFEHYYDVYAMSGVIGNNDFASLNNFDGRSSLDLAIAGRAIKLSKIVDKYIKSDFDQAYLERAKKKFFDDIEYDIFKKNEKDWLHKIARPVYEIAYRLQNKVTPQVSDRMFNKVHKKRAILEILSRKAANQDVFQFLFSILEFSKGEFNKLLPDLCGVQGSREMQVYDAFTLSARGTDLQLVEKVLDDPHPIVLVHCGNKHAAQAFKYFKMMENRGVRTVSVDLLKQPFINNNAAIYHVMRELVSN